MSTVRDAPVGALRRAPAALLLIDYINDLEFEGAERLLPRAVEAAGATAELRRRARAAGLPVIYANDNFGRWRSDFREVVEHCLGEVRGRPVAERLRPGRDDYFVLKPRHSAFYATTLETLLAQLGARRLVLAGIAGDICVLLTAIDAYMRGYELHVPGDCMASESEDENAHALAYMRRVLKADVTESGALDLEALMR